ncbi:nuclear transport factor 2 family protein [Streptomyces sp. A1136]|nr:nuclear transport factor 2 family protein [Streptomyces sp. A1136]
MAGRSFRLRGVAALTFPTTAEVIHCFNRAFIEHDASSLADLIADDCVMEAREPAPDGARYEGRAECPEFCRALAEDHTIQFEPEAGVITGERATVRRRHHFGDGPTDSARGVSLTLVRDGLIVESLGYSKTTGDAPPAKTGIHGKQGKS